MKGYVVTTTTLYRVSSDGKTFAAKSGGWVATNYAPFVSPVDDTLGVIERLVENATELTLEAMMAHTAQKRLCVWL